MTEPTATLPPPPPPEKTGGGRKKIVIGAIAAVLVIAVAGGGYAVFNKLSGGGPQPHDVMPASTQFYARLDVDPSASQKVELLKLIRKFPDVAESVGIKSVNQDIRKLAFDQIIAKECPSIDYQEDVEPWLGERIGVGGNIKDESFVIAVQTTDEDKARDGIKKLFACADEKYGIAFLDGYAILSENQADVDTSIKETAKGSLGDDKGFTDDFTSLGDQGVASAWVDIEALADLPELKEVAGASLDDLKKAGALAATVRVEGNALEVAALGGPLPSQGARTGELGKLPADTVAALSVAGVGPVITEQADALINEFSSGFAGGLTGDESADPQEFLDGIEQATGLKVPEDIATLFGDSLTLAVGGKNLETLPALSGPSDIAGLDVALSLKSTQAPALDLVQRLAALAEQVGVALVTAPTEQGAVLATNQAAADAVVKPEGTLGKKGAFTEVFPDGDSYGGLFVNIGGIVDKLQEAGPPDDIAKDLEQAKPLSALGFSVSQGDDKRSLTRLRLSFRE